MPSFSPTETIEKNTLSSLCGSGNCIWNQIGERFGENPGDDSGRSISLSSDGKRLAIGASKNDGGGSGTSAGHVRVFEQVSDTWIQVGLDIDGREAEEESGYSVDLNSDGTKMIVGSRYGKGGRATGAGLVRVFELIDGKYMQIGNGIKGVNAGDFFGIRTSISSDGLTISAGSIKMGNSAGHLSVYRQVNNAWTILGQEIIGEDPGDNLGWSQELSANGTVIAIGAPYNDGQSGADSGHVRVYEYISNSGTWLKLGQDLDGSNAGDEMGYSVSISEDGTTVACGARGNDMNGNNAGQVKVFTYDFGNSVWQQVGQDINGKNAGDRFGASVSLSSNGRVLAVGASDKPANGIGARVFEFLDDSWVQIGDLLNGDDLGDLFGMEVSLSSQGKDIAIAGRKKTDANGDVVGHVRVYHAVDS